MNLALKLTVAALVRSLKGLAHDLADDIESDFRRRKPVKARDEEATKHDEDER